MKKWIKGMGELGHIFGWDECSEIINFTAKLLVLARTWYKSVASLDHD